MNNLVEIPPVTLSEKVKAYIQLLKMRLTITVVSSGAFGYVLASQDHSINWINLLLLCVGSFLATGTANIINQVIEKDIDKLMKRTKARPLPTGKLSVTEALVFGGVIGFIGLSILFIFLNPLTSGLTLLSVILYGLVYTPLKQKTPLCVLVGAFPGAMPPLIGWAAYAGTLGIEAGIIFAIQFFWQFPHFWAIAWVGHEEYKKAGLKMLPTKGGKNITAAVQIMIYTVVLIPLGLIPVQLGLAEPTAGTITTICGSLFLAQTFYLMKEGSDKAALMLMFGSFLYLPIVQISYLVFKI